jgi:hypothetical protein
MSPNLDNGSETQQLSANIDRGKTTLNYNSKPAEWEVHLAG